MSLTVMRCELGATGAGVVTAERSVLDYLGGFYRLVEEPPRPGEWVVDARIGPPGPRARPTRWGVHVEADRAARTVFLRAREPRTLAVSTRKSVREALVDHCERRRYVMLHASAVADEDLMVVFVGDKGSGKTTLALRAMLEAGMRYVSNDHLICFPSTGTPEGEDLPTRLTLTSLPTLIPVKVGTFLDLEDRLPPPWDTDGTNVQAWRNLPRQHVYGVDQRVLFTFGSLGQDSPTRQDLGTPAHGPGVWIVLASYGGEQALRTVADPVTELMRHVREDWVFSPSLNQRYLPRVERDRDAYRRDACRLVSGLTRRARVIAWTHQGHPGPLLDHLRAEEEPWIP